MNDAMRNFKDEFADRNRVALQNDDLASERMGRLIKSQEFRTKYLAGDEAAVGLFNRLIEHRANGRQVATDYQMMMVGDPGGRLGAGHVGAGTRGPSVSQQAAALIANPEFCEKYFAGDREAVAQWNAATITNQIAEVQTQQAAASEAASSSSEGAQ